MLKLAVGFVIFAVTLAGCAAPPNQMPSESLELKKALSQTETATKAVFDAARMNIDRKVRGQDSDCSVSAWSQTLTATEALKRSAVSSQNELRRAQDAVRDAQSNPFTTSNQKYRASLSLIDAREVNDFYTETLPKTMFYAADTALQYKCFNIADGYYRDIVATFVGSSYAALRQRASIGIEDVRRGRSP